MTKSIKNLNPGICILVLGALFVSTFLARPIQDPDFFWHLKTGEWLWETKTWPIPDPFSFTTAQDLETWQVSIIKGYWASQILYYLLYSVMGFSGIFLLRLLLLTAFALILARNRHGSSWAWFFATTMVLSSIFAHYPIERPHFYSFLFFLGIYLITIRIIEGRDKTRKGLIITATLLMLVWGNFHAGVIVGQTILFIALGMSFVPRFFHQKLENDIKYSLRILAVCGFAAGFFNLNAQQTFFTLTHNLTNISSSGANALINDVNTEYVSILLAWRGEGRVLVIQYLIFVVLTIIALFSGVKRQNPFCLLVTLGTGLYAAMHIRFIPFFELAALPVLAIGLSAYSWQRHAKGVAVVFALALLTYLTSKDWQNIATVKNHGWVIERDFPVGVADKLLESNLNGRLFNPYLWGGYLLWRLGPDRQVFIDGRNLNQQATRDALAAEMVGFGGRLIWKEIFDKYSISYAILPKTLNGSPYPLTWAIARDPQWRAVYESGNAVLLLKVSS